MKNDSAMKNVVGHRFLPDNFNISDVRNSNELFLLKTHDHPRATAIEETDRIIYIIRDGRESSLSLFRYLNDISSDNKTLLDVIYGVTFTGGWGEHVRAWAPKTRTNTLMIRFEELTENPSSQIERLSDFLNIPLVSNRIPTFEELHAINPKFFRQGKHASWKQVYTEFEHNAFWLMNYAAMIEHEYTDEMPNVFKSESTTVDQFLNIFSASQNYISSRLASELYTRKRQRSIWTKIRESTRKRMGKF
jgi:hypothetical protein